MGRALITSNRSSNPRLTTIASEKCWFLGRLPVITRNRDYLLDVDTGTYVYIWVRCTSNRVFFLYRRIDTPPVTSRKQTKLLAQLLWRGRYPI